MAARTQASVHDIQQLADLTETKPEPLNSPYKPKTVHCPLVVEPISGTISLGRREEAYLFVIANRVGSHTHLHRELRHCQGHVASVNLGVDSNVNARAAKTTPNVR
jgi:hypothetical protein